MYLLPSPSFLLLVFWDAAERWAPAACLVSEAFAAVGLQGAVRGAGDSRHLNAAGKHLALFAKKRGRVEGQGRKGRVS